MFFNKSKSLFLAIICFFAIQITSLNAAQEPAVGTGLWATFVASMNNLMPSLSSLMSNIAAKISNFMTSTSSSEYKYKGYAVAGLSGLLATVLSYEALVRAPKRAEELNHLKGELELSGLDGGWPGSTGNLDRTVLKPILNVEKIVKALNSDEYKKSIASLRNLLAMQEEPIAQAMKKWNPTDRIAQEDDYEKALATKYGHNIAALKIHLGRVLGIATANNIIQPWKENSTYLSDELTKLIEWKNKN